MTKINLWASPRNVSTAFMYSFAQRQDTTVIDEPLYAHFLKKTGVDHPGGKETLETMENDGNKVVQTQLLGEFDKPIVFFKQMTHHLVDIEKDFMYGMKNILFIRDPYRILASYTKVVAEPKMRDVGVQQQWELLQHLQEKNSHVVVLDSRDLLIDPAKMLTKLCATLDIPFDQKMLTWEKGARPEDGIWEKHWYTNVHNSTGFKPYEEKVVNLPENLQPLAQKCWGYYQQLREYALR